jgi:hypothetical protein
MLVKRILLLLCQKFKYTFSKHLTVNAEIVCAAFNYWQDRMRCALLWRCKSFCFQLYLYIQRPCYGVLPKHNRRTDHC